MLLVTGATGKLGHHVLTQLRAQAPHLPVCALVRDVARAKTLAQIGVELRVGDYNAPAQLQQAMAGVSRLLLISSSDMGHRQAQHKAAIEAAKAAGVQHLVYTSLLHADSSALTVLAADHTQTETAIRNAQIPHTFLRNGWYLENYTENLAPALQHGAILGCAGAARICAAARADYAAAAVAVLTQDGHVGKTYELAGDASFTMDELAQTVSRASGRPVAYQNLTEAEYEKTLQSFGLPSAVAHMLADSDTGAARGGLYDAGRALSKLIGRPTTPLDVAVAQALR
jgi:NAD(P)H dehydrogenase (quinone)